jgi:hypothetical protein
MLARANFCITGNLELPQDQRLVVNMVVVDLMSRKPPKALMWITRITKVD